MPDECFASICAIIPGRRWPCGRPRRRRVDGFATTDGHNWTQIWIIPAAIAGVALVLFLILFTDQRHEQATMLDASRTTFEAPGTAVPQEERPRSSNT